MIKYQNFLLEWGERCQAEACGGARYLPSLIALFVLVISHYAEGSGWEILKCPPSVRLFITFRFHTATQRRIAVFSSKLFRYFSGSLSKITKSHFMFSLRFMLFSKILELYFVMWGWWCFCQQYKHLGTNMEHYVLFITYFKYITYFKNI